MVKDPTDCKTPIWCVHQLASSRLGHKTWIGSYMVGRLDFLALLGDSLQKRIVHFRLA